MGPMARRESTRELSTERDRQQKTKAWSAAAGDRTDATHDRALGQNATHEGETRSEGAVGGGVKHPPRKPTSVRLLATASRCVRLSRSRSRKRHRPSTSLPRRPPAAIVAT